MTTFSRKRELHIASVSDIHLAHRRTPTIHILENLYVAFPDNESTAKLDIIFIAGDVFERMLKFPDPDITEIEIWVTYMLRLCVKHNIILRVLEGTPSHDCKQSEVFERINSNAEIGCNLRYVKDLRIETIPEIDSTILYIPDEWGDSAEFALSQTRELMTSLGLSKVDYAVMHGQFEFQVPMVGRTHKVHHLESYMQLVDKLIFIGHDHHFAVCERAIAQGSFDRISHGEEAPKGHVRAIVRSRDDYELTFVENKGAKIHKTVDCSEWSLDETMVNLKAIVESMPVESFIRVLCKKNSPLTSNIAILENTWPGIIWSKKVEDSDGEKIQNTKQALGENDFVPMEITKDNIVTLLMGRLRTKTSDEETIKLAEQFINEVK